MNSDFPQKAQWWRKAMAFLISQGITLFGSQIVQMAIIWYVTMETSSGKWITVLTLVSFLPQMVISLFAGVWADRYNRKQMIILADVTIAAATLALALLMMSGSLGEDTLAAIVIVSAVRSIGSGIHAPTVNAMLPQIVPEDGLMRVNGINGSIQSVVQFVSPIAAGAIMAIGPIYNILLIDVATAVIGVGILALLNIPKHLVVERTGATSVFSEMKEGFSYTWHHSFLKRLLSTYGAYIFLCVPSGFLATLMIERTFGDNVLFLTINETVGFAGAMVGGLLLGASGGFKNRNLTLFLGTLVYSVASLAVGFTGVFWLFATLMFFLGLTIPAAQSSVFTLVQEKADPAMLGRVFSLVNVMFTGFMPLGMLIFGPLADVVRVQTLVVICAVLSIGLSLSILLSRDFFNAGLAPQSAEGQESIATALAAH